MDTVIQAATVIAAFAALHERTMELLKQLGEKQGWWNWKEEERVDRWNILIAFLLATVTHANLIELFVHVTGEDGKEVTSLFFRHYLAWPTAWAEWQKEAAAGEIVGGLGGRLLQEATGFMLMALSTALGSKFWHDLVKALVDLRGRAREVAQAAEPTAGPPLPPAQPQAAEGVFYSASAESGPPRT